MNHEEKEQFLIQMGIAGLGVGMAAFRNRPDILIPLSFGTVMLSGFAIVNLLTKEDEKKKEIESVSKVEERVVPSFNL